MTNRTLRLGALLLLPLVAACSSITVRSDYDTAADFSKLRTYGWLQKPSDLPRDPRIDNDLIDSRVRSAVNDELWTKGYTESPNPDFRVTYHVMLQSKFDVQAFPVSYGYGLGRVGAMSTDVQVSEYEMGTLLLDVVNSATNDLVWRGSAQARVDPNRTPQERTKRIREAVHEMLEQFPPKR
jgi:hypothetical protein